MVSSPSELRRIQQRLAILKERERELQIQFSQSHATLAETATEEAELLAVAEEIVNMETALTSITILKIA